MSAIVPDTLQGALIFSVIDFFLSFVIISGIGVVHRILQIEPNLRSAGWVSEGRVAHHASHAPKNG